jgi:hypothetical protein
MLSEAKHPVLQQQSRRGRQRQRPAIRALALFTAGTALAAACNGGGDVTFAYTPVPVHTDDRGQQVSCAGLRPYIADEVLVATTLDRADSVVERARALGFALRSRSTAPTNVHWLTLGVPAGAVPDATAALLEHDGVLQAMPNYVTYRGDVATWGSECDAGQPTGS